MSKIRLNQDVLKFDLDTIIENDETVLVANLPYYITIPIITYFLEGRFNIKPITVMVQKEALKKLGTLKAEMVIFEDASHAIKTAKSAGFYVVGVYDEMFKADEEIIRKAVDRFIYTFKELEKNSIK